MASETEKFFKEIYKTFKAHFGDAAKHYWVYDSDLCPCCQTWPIELMDYKGEEALSVNAYMYRDRGVMIAYLLCPACAEFIMAQPHGVPTAMHPTLEKNLADAYLRHLNSMNA